MKKAILIVAGSAIGIGASILAKRQLKKQETQKKLNEIKKQLDELEQKVEDEKKTGIEKGDDTHIFHHPM